MNNDNKIIWKSKRWGQTQVTWVAQATDAPLWQLAFFCVRHGGLTTTKKKKEKEKKKGRRRRRRMEGGGEGEEETIETKTKEERYVCWALCRFSHCWFIADKVMCDLHTWFGSIHLGSFGILWDFLGFSAPNLIKLQVLTNHNQPMKVSNWWNRLLKPLSRPSW